MFFYDKMKDRDFAAKTVRVLARQRCEYRDARNLMVQQRCDCKYGVANVPDDQLGQYRSEVSGCPELNMLDLIIQAIPKRDWERIVKKAWAQNVKNMRRTVKKTSK